MTGRVGELLAKRAAEGLVGRHDELCSLLRCLDDGGPLVVHVHGIGGIGKSTLLRAFGARAEALGAAVIPIDCRVVEPTGRGFLRQLGETLGCRLETPEEAVAALEQLSGRVVITLDTYERLRLLDTWLRQIFLPAQADSFRLVLAGRQPPVPAWMTLPEWRELFLEIQLSPLGWEEALELLARDGVGAEAAAKIAAFAAGHPLALKLAATAARDRPAVDFENLTVPNLVLRLSRLFLEDIDAPLTRTALEAASVVRRATRSVLQAMLPDVDAATAWDSLEALPILHSQPDGLGMHDAVHEAIAGAFKAADPSRLRDYRRAAWRQLREEVRTAGATELWRYTADMLYLVENPVAREAFFPSGAQEFTVEPAKDDDGAGIAALTSRHEGPEAARQLAFWWERAPSCFHVVRDADHHLVGFYCMFDPRTARVSDLERDPVTAAWAAHLRKEPLSKKLVTLFLRRWLSLEHGESPSAVQAACWLDIKRTYMELRPELRRVYLTVVDLPTYAPVAIELGFQPIAEAELELDERTYHTAMLDFGPSSVDGWLAGLAAAELAIEEEGLLDMAARQLVVGDRRVDLTRLEFELLAYLMQSRGRAISRFELLEKVWGHEHTGASNVVDVVIRSLRKKLGRSAPALATVRGVGYRFQASQR